MKPHDAGLAQSATQEPEDDALERALRDLPPRDLAPAWARAHYAVAEARLTGGPEAASLLQRCEPGLLMGLAALHMAWALLRVFGA
jgi:hypothetical protein